MILRPSAGFVYSHPAHFVALGFGTGLSPFAPGTVGTLLAFPLYALLSERFEPFELFILICAFFALGVWACGRTGEALGIADHTSMNWDEIVAFLLVLMLTPEGLAWQAFAFFAFRFFDVVKPQPIRYFDRTIKGGFGVMFDDIFAGFYTLLAMALIRHIWA
jgi:phosphatidylglycerophosphatase A